MLLDNSESQEIKMGIGMVMHQVVEAFDYGHMWVYWKEKKDNFYPHCIGYYPVIEDIPLEVLQSKIKIFKCFARNSVRGLYQVDLDAEYVMTELSNKIFCKEWNITQKQLIRLKNRCHISQGKSQKLEGRYSWNTERTDWNNCSSWALNIACYVMEYTNFLKCSSPKQLNTVKKEIYWDCIPILTEDSINVYSSKRN